VQQVLELADLALGAGHSADNVFLSSHRLRTSRPMQFCRKRLARDPAQVTHPGLAFTDLIALLMSWRHTHTPIDELESPAEQARTTAYSVRQALAF
jgi:hypothetical protein